MEKNIIQESDNEKKEVRRARSPARALSPERREEKITELKTKLRLMDERDKCPVDRDRSKLTDFRQLANNSAGKNGGLVGWFSKAAGLDYSDEEEPPQDEKDDIDPVPASPVPDEATTALTQRERKTHWMSDKNCIVCYECQTQFGVFTRRHHCRLCGQIFCEDCSKYRVPAKPFGFPNDRIRVCKHCYDTAVQELSRRERELSRRASSMPTGSLEDHPVGASIPTIAGSGKQNEKHSERKSVLSSASMRFSKPAAKTAALLPTGPPTAVKEKEKGDGDNDNLCESDEDYENDGLGYYRMLSNDSAAAEQKEALPELDHFELANHSELDTTQQDQLNQLVLLHETHLRWLIIRLVDANELAVMWAELVSKMVNRAVSSVRPNVVDGDAMDISHYVKIKTVPGGSPSDCAYVDGVVFRKQLAHKRMRPVIDRPRVLLMSCALEYQRNDNRLSSLDVISKQEEEYLNIVATQIAQLKPDVVVVEKAVSRHAQEIFLKEDITLLLNVKRTVLERLARCCESMLITSMDQITHKRAIGVAGRFRMEHVTVRDPREGKTDASKRVYYAVFEGCRPRLQATVMLRGADEPTLKRLKRVVRMASTAGYNLLLETAVMMRQNAIYPPDLVAERCAWYSKQEATLLDGGSLVSGPVLKAVGSRAREAVTPMSLSPFVEMTAVERPVGSKPWLVRGLLFGMCWITEHWQCFVPQVKGYNFYSRHDKTLGQFLIQDCFDQRLRCLNPKCGKAPLHHKLGFQHARGRLVLEMKQRSEIEWKKYADKFTDESKDYYGNLPLILTFVKCKTCKDKNSFCAPPSRIEPHVYHYSFGRFLDVTFNNTAAICRNESCCHSIHHEHVRYFWCKRQMVSFEYSDNSPYKVEISLSVWYDTQKQTAMLKKEISHIMRVTHCVFVDVINKIEELQGLQMPNLDMMRLSKLHEQVISERIYLEKTFRTLGFSLITSAGQTPRLRSFLPSLNTRLSTLSALPEDDNEPGGEHHQIETVNENESGGGGGVDEHENARVRKRVYVPLPSPLCRSEWMKLAKQPAHDPNGLELPFDTFELNRLRKRLLMDIKEWNTVFTAILAPIRHSHTRSESRRFMEPTLELKELADQLSLTVGSHITSIDVPKPAVQAVALVSPEKPAEKPAEPIENKSSVEKVPAELANHADSGDLVTHETDHAAAGSVSASNPAEAEKGGELKSEKTGDTNREHAASDGSVKIQSSSLMISPSSAATFWSKRENLDHLITAEGLLSKNPLLLQLGAELFFGLRKNETGNGYSPSLAHFFLPPTNGDLVIPVFEDEPSSMVAYALSSSGHIQCLAKIKIKDYLLNSQRQSAKQQISKQTSYEREAPTLPAEDTNTGLSAVTTPTKSSPAPTSLPDSQAADPVTFAGGIRLVIGDEKAGPAHDDPKGKGSSIKISSSNPARSDKALAKERDDVLEQALLAHDEEEFEEVFEDVIGGSAHDKADLTSFTCTVFFPRQFHAMRVKICGGDYDFIQSLSRCNKWQATGGKSGAGFGQTQDGRFVMKYVSRDELKTFLKMAKIYFAHMAKVLFHRTSSCMIKILGAYQVHWTKPNKFSTGGMKEKYIIVMPNLFYNLTLTRIFDLKGSLRNRYVKGAKNNRVVLLDMNFLESTMGYSLPLLQASQLLLDKCVLNDTEFLAGKDVVDYSMLVGVDDKNKQLVVGIIDYIGLYTWKKGLETAGKSVGMIAGRAAPTIIQPTKYKERFREAMHRYFMVAPDQFSSPENLQDPKTDAGPDPKKEPTDTGLLSLELLLTTPFTAIVQD